MSTISRKKLILNTVAVNLGCGSCRRPKLASIFSPKAKSKTTPKYQKHQNLSYYPTRDKSGNSYESSTYQTNSTFSPNIDTTTSSSSTSSQPSKVDGVGGVRPKSVAVEKESNDPYLDFRQSMLQMIVENEIYSKDDLKELLNCFLQLNSPSLHGIIIRVFTEIWNGFFFSGKTNYSSPGFYVRSNSYDI
ncbi:transcription repressor OFP6-like [Silene latifolia]|uniref:transcription repressor OFP6-like n=1 Tax=Silene latifolia TaxID=37657 RepID=UPI003D787C8A